MTPTPLPARCHPCPLRVMPTPCPARCHSHTFSWVPPISLLLGMLTLPSHLFGYHPCLYSWVAPTLSPNPPGISHVPSLRWHQPPPSSPPRPQSQPSGTHIPSPGDPATCDSCSFSWVVPTTSLLLTPSPLLAGCHLLPSEDTNPVPTPSHVPPVSLLLDGTSHLPPLHPIHAPVCHP